MQIFNLNVKIIRKHPKTFSNTSNNTVHVPTCGLLIFSARLVPGSSFRGQGPIELGFRACQVSIEMANYFAVFFRGFLLDHYKHMSPFHGIAYSFLFRMVDLGHMQWILENTKTLCIYIYIQGSFTAIKKVVMLMQNIPHHWGYT